MRCESAFAGRQKRLRHALSKSVAQRDGTQTITDDTPFTFSFLSLSVLVSVVVLLHSAAAAAVVDDVPASVLSPEYTGEHDVRAGDPLSGSDLTDNDFSYSHCLFLPVSGACVVLVLCLCLCIYLCVLCRWSERNKTIILFASSHFFLMPFSRLSTSTLTIHHPHALPLVVPFML